MESLIILLVSLLAILAVPIIGLMISRLIAGDRERRRLSAEAPAETGAAPAAVEVNCTGCGAVNQLIPGQPGDCEYCDTPLSVPAGLKPLKAAFTSPSGLEFVLIPAGAFIRREIFQDDFGEKKKVLRQRVVNISRPFYLGKYLVTQEQWVAVMGPGSNPSAFKGRVNPVENISWNEAQLFIQKLNQKEGRVKYRLPTEAEWEHASRAGSDTAWFYDDKEELLREYGWFAENSQSSTHPVGLKKPHPWGLYDIFGNVWEWVADWAGADSYSEEEQTDPPGPATGSDRVAMGGAFDRTASGYYRGLSSICAQPEYRDRDLGFRLAFSPDN